MKLYKQSPNIKNRGQEGNRVLVEAKTVIEICSLFIYCLPHKSIFFLNGLKFKAVNR